MAAKGMKQSKILWQISGLILVILTVSFVVILAFNISSTARLVENSKDKLIASHVEDMSTGIKYLTDQAAVEVANKYTMSLSDLSALDPFIQSMINRQPSPIQLDANNVLKDFVANNIFGIKIDFASIPAIPPALKEPMIVVSNKDDMLFQEVPKSIQEIYKSDKNYGLIKSGIPEFGLKEEQLVVFYKVEVPSMPAFAFYQTTIRPLHDDLAEIDDYYKEQRSKINLVMIIVIAASFLAVLLVTFFVLRLLIRSQITKPIEELSSVAETVMEGNLDVEVSIKKGEEFESLKRAFNEMVKSVRDIINRSSGGQE